MQTKHDDAILAYLAFSLEKRQSLVETQADRAALEVSLALSTNFFNTCVSNSTSRARLSRNTGVCLYVCHGLVKHSQMSISKEIKMFAASSVQCGRSDHEMLPQMPESAPSSTACSS